MRHRPSFAADGRACLTGSLNSTLTLSLSAFIQMMWLQSLMSFNQICPTSALWRLHGSGAESATLTSQWRRQTKRRGVREERGMDPWGRLFHETVTFPLVGPPSAPQLPIFCLIFLKNTMFSHVWGQELVPIQDDALGSVILSQVVGECWCTSNNLHQTSQR